MAIKTYSYKKDKNIKLTEHFQVGECRCKDGTDKILVDTTLATISEKVRTHFNCKKIVIISGYRTTTHDKKVGGSGNGYHTKGQAWDIKCVDKNNKTINPKYICCYLQDLNVKGIGYICSSTVHIDTRKNKFWFDETKNNKSIGSCFYKYFNIDKEKIYPKTKEETNKDKEINVEPNDSFNKDIILSTNLEEKKDIPEEDNKKIKFKYTCTTTGYKKIKIYKNETLIIE